MFPLIILIRILFITSMVFIMGYVFGNFSKRPALATITKVAAILIVLLFITANAVFRFGNWHNRNYNGNNCWYHQSDSTTRK